jgi:hypothetical protein
VHTNLKPTYHRSEPDGARHEVIECDSALLCAVSVHQDVEYVVVESVAGRVERLAQFEGAQRPGLLSVIQFEDRLKSFNIFFSAE